MFRAIRRLWSAYRALRIAAWALGALGAAAGFAGAAWALAARRLRARLMTDSPEFADDTRIDPFGLAGLRDRLPRIPRPDLPALPVWPVAAALGAMAVVWLILHIPMGRPDNPFDRDEPRLFSDADRTWISKITGGRCEHRWLFGLLRCRHKGEHMDHHYPWSKGGATDRHNLVWLCARHNIRKSDHVPTWFDTWVLYRARLKYLPPRWRGYARPDGVKRYPGEDDAGRGEAGAAPAAPAAPPAAVPFDPMGGADDDGFFDDYDDYGDDIDGGEHDGSDEDGRGAWASTDGA